MMLRRLFLAVLLALGACSLARHEAQAALVRADFATPVTNSVANTTDGAWSAAYTVTAGAELLACAVIMQENPDITGGGANVGEVATFTYAGTSLTRRVQSAIADKNIRVEWWTQTSPATGSNTLAGSLDAFTDSFTVHCLTVSGGVDTTTPVRDTGINSASDVNWTVSIASPVSTSLLFAAGGGKGNDLAPFAPVSGTELADGTSGASTSTDHSYWVAERLGASPLAATATLADIWDMAAIEVQEAGAAAGSVARMAGLLTLGVGGGPAAVSPPPPAACTVELAPGSSNAQINSAIASALDGSTICLPTSEIITITTTLVMNCTSRALTLDLRGSRLQQGNEAQIVLDMRGTLTSRGSVTRATVGGNTVLTSATLAANTAVGEWVRFRSEDQLPDDDTTAGKMGQFMQVIAISGSDVTLRGIPYYTSSFTTGLAADTLHSRDCRLTSSVLGGNIRGIPTAPTMTQNIVHVTELLNPLIDRVRIVDNHGGGFGSYSTVGAHYRYIDCRNFPKLTSDNPECLHSRSSWQTLREGVYCEGVGHCVDGHRQTYGADFEQHNRFIFARANNQAGGRAFGLHAGTRYSTTEDMFILDGFGCGTFRGQNHTVRRVACINNTNGWQLSVSTNTGTEFPNGDAINLTFDRVTTREIDSGPIAVSNATCCTNNAYTNGRMEAYVSISSGGFQTRTGSVFIPSVTNDVDTWTSAGGSPATPVTIGDDMVYAGAGNDSINALAGADRVWGGLGADTITLGSGRDSLIYTAESEAADTITDFLAGSGGDIIDISPFLAQFAGADYQGDPFSDGYVATSQSGGDCLLRLDEDATAGPGAATTVASLTGVTCANIVFGARSNASDNWKIDLIEP